MKFVLAKEHLYWWPVTVDMPDPDKPGKWLKFSYTHQFVSVGNDEAIALQKEIAELKDDAEKAARQHDMLVKASRNWRDVVDEDKQEVPFSEEALRAALEHTWYRAGLYNAYFKSLTSDEARKGN
ncbi:MAG: hypothetical protein E5V89_21210 [Mesorhizobium sp.]|nr:MAG: hypothetical protein E5V89_21210 [Mesorhizobium sp.]